MTGDSFTITKGQVAYLLNVDVRTLTTYQGRAEDPLPIANSGRRGQQNEYDPRDIVNWSQRQELRKLNIDSDGRLFDYEAEKARLTYHQANKSALEEETLTGALIPADMVKQTWSSLVMSFRAKMIGLPNKAAPQVIGVDDLRETEQILQDFIYEALSELAASGIPNDSGGSDADGKATAAADSKPVGRRKEKVKSRKQCRAGGMEDKQG